MPRDNDKDNDSRGRRDRPGDGKSRAGAARAARGGKGRSGAARGPEKKFAKRGFAGKATVTSATASGVPMPGSPTARNRSARSLIPAIESLTPASATATIVRRAGILAMRRARAAIGRMRLARHAATMVKSVRSSRVKIVAGREAPVQAARRPSEFQSRRPPAAARSGGRRCASGGTFVRTEVRRQEALYPARGRRREAALHAARRRFRKDGDRRVAIGPSARGRRAMAIVPRRPAGAKIWRRQEILARCARSWPAQEFWRRPDRGADRGEFKAVAEARGSRRARCPSRPRRRAQFRQAAL